MIKRKKHSVKCINKEKMDSMNDSGYSSPPKCSDGAVEEKIRFFTKRKRSDPGRDTVVASTGDALAYTLKQRYPNMNVKNTLFWAQIRGHDGMKCVNPLYLPCGFIQPGTEIEMEDMNEMIYDYVEKLQHTKPYSKLQGKPFFISIRDRKHKSLLTKVHYKNLRYNDICVVASDVESYEEALIKDSRFINVDRFELSEKVEGCVGPKINIKDKPSDFKEGMLLEVKVQKAQSSNTCKPHSISMNPSNYPATSTVEQPASETPRKHKRIQLNQLAKKLLGKKVVYVFSKDITELTAQEIRNEMDHCLRARAWCSLVGPKDRAGNKYEKSIKKIAQVQFANPHITARPVSFSKTIYPLYDSIGLIECGSVAATCFLISSSMIATNWHVVDAITKARMSSTHSNHTDVLVYFDYEKREEKMFSKGYKLFPLLYPENVVSKDFDYAFLCLLDRLEGKEALGKFVSCKVPDLGNACIVGHPNGTEKQEELCPILPLHDDRRSLELERRQAANEQRCENNPTVCTLTSNGRECVHLYHSNIQKLYGNKSVLTYDVGSMLEGSSGAPVFDMSGKIVALHTRGFRLEETSIVEVGTTFQAIINHLRARGRSDFVRKNFPHCWEENMEET